MNLNILIVGVGGQGTLLASKIFGEYALLKGLDCKLSEVHGMAQRGGSVVTFVRIGEKVHSPVIDRKQADVIIAFEELEALRWADYLKETGGRIIINKQNIYPMPVITGNAVYPADIEEQLKHYDADVRYINATVVAERLGNFRAANVVVLGFSAGIIGLDAVVFRRAIENSVNHRFVSVNLSAFEEGYRNV